MTADRRQARAAYKERTPEAGIYAVRRDGAVWVGASADLEKIGNQLGFSLRTGRHPNRALQSACADGDFEMEVVEVLPPTADRLARDLKLRDRLDHWIEKLGASRL